MFSHQGCGFSQGVFQQREGIRSSPLLLNSSLYGSSLPPVRCGIAGRRWYCHSNRGHTLSVDPRDNAVNLTASEGATSTLVLCHLLHLMTTLVLIPPQLSHPVWTGMRRMKIGYESYICFPALYIPPNVPESECNSQQLTLMGGLYVPKAGVLLDLAKQLDSLRTAAPRPKVSDLKLGDKHSVKYKTPKKIKPVDTRDTPKKHHKSCEEKGRLKQSLTKKSPALSNCEHDVGLKANRLGDVVAQACLSVARMMRVVESTHNSKIAEALLARQCLEKASAKAIDSVMDEIWGAHTPADMWQVEKRISVCISHKRAKAYKALWSNTTMSLNFPLERMAQAVGPLRLWRWKRNSANL